MRERPIRAVDDGGGGGGVVLVVAGVGEGEGAGREGRCMIPSSSSANLIARAPRSFPRMTFLERRNGLRTAAELCFLADRARCQSSFSRMEWDSGSGADARVEGEEERDEEARSPGSMIFEYPNATKPGDAGISFLLVPLI